MKSKIIFWKWQQKQYSASALMGAHEMSATHDYLKQEQNKISWLLFRPKLQTWPYSLHSLTNLKIRILMISHLQRVAQCLAQGQYCVNTGEKEWLNAHPPIERGLHRNLEDVGEKNGRTVPTMHSAFPVASFTYLLGSRSPWCYLTPSSKRGNGAPRGSVTQPEVEKGWHPDASGCWHLPPPPPLQLSLPSPAGTCISGTYKSARSSRHHCLQGIKQGRSWGVGGSPVRNRAWRATNPRVMGPSSSPFWLKRLKEFSSNPRNYPFPFSGDVAIKETWQREAVGLERSVVQKSPESSTINALIVFITHFSLKRQTSSFPFSSPRSQMFNIPD